MGEAVVSEDATSRGAATSHKEASTLLVSGEVLLVDVDLVDVDLEGEHHTGDMGTDEPKTTQRFL